MNIDINSTHLSSDDMLNELILQSLDKILGSHHKVISRDLPFTCGHPILALDSRQYPALVVVDRREGGQALLSGLKILEALNTHRAWVFRLYPELFGNDQHALRPHDIQLFILAPTAPPGIDYLTQGFTQLHAFTFQALLVNGEAALLINAVTEKSEPAPTRAADKIKAEIFRTGMPELEKTEEDYFRNLNIMA